MDVQLTSHHSLCTPSMLRHNYSSVHPTPNRPIAARDSFSNPMFSRRVGGGFVVGSRGVRGVVDGELEGVGRDFRLLRRRKEERVGFSEEGREEEREADETREERTLFFADGTTILGWAGLL